MDLKNIPIEKLNLTRQEIDELMNSKKQLSYETAIKIHIESEGQIDINDLRPDMKYFTNKYIDLLVEKFQFNINDDTAGELEMPLDVIKITKRFRTYFGDIKGLAECIEECGLIQPVSVNINRELVCGMRRYLAFKYLGRKTIPVVFWGAINPIWGEIIDNLDLLPSDLLNKIEKF